MGNVPLPPALTIAGFTWRIFAHRRLADAGVAVADSSAFRCRSFEPVLATQSCVTRTGWDGTPMGSEQRLPPMDALSLS
jgi:predicted amidohydrolase YtcJ